MKISRVTASSIKRRTALGAAILGLLTLTACRAPRVERPLFDALHQPLVLTESHKISLPNSPRPNRLVKGWREPSRKGKPRFNARPGALIQGVHLVGPAKVLTLVADVMPRTGPLLRQKGRCWSRPLSSAVSASE